ncbi:MAG: hypothetical protein ACLGI3_03605, partial [Actinomycetes bacterium]
RPGDAVTAAEASTLARLLHLNLQRGGADFVITAPYDRAVLTVSGEVDFRRTVGRAQAVTTFGDGRPDDVRTVFFTDEHIWSGNVPGLAESLAGAGAPDAAYLRRPVASPGEPPVLVDFVLGVLLNLSAVRPDDPAAFRRGDYSWEGQRSIDSRLTSLYGLPSGRSVAVGSGGLLTQFVTPLPGGDSSVTVTLSDHGRRRLAVPAEQKTADVADHPELAAAFGL